MRKTTKGFHGAIHRGLWDYIGLRGAAQGYMAVHRDIHKATQYYMGLCKGFNETTQGYVGLYAQGHIWLHRVT